MTSCGVVGLQRSECGVNKCGRLLLVIRISSSLHSINPPDPCSPLIGQNLIAVSSHYMENSMPYLACLPVGGASLANDAGRSECGVNKCGEASYLLRVELRVLKIAISSL